MSIETWIYTLIGGTIASCLAPFFIWLAKRIFAPKIDIVPFIVTDPMSKIVQVKIINNSRVKLTDITLFLDYLDKKETGGYTIKSLVPAKDFHVILGKYKNDKKITNPDAEYCLVMSFCFDDDPLTDTQDKFVLTVKAVHPVTGSTVYKIRDFKCNTKDIKLNHKFCKGDNHSSEVR